MKLRTWNTHSNSAQTLIELLLALALASILLPSLITGLVSSREGKAQQSIRIEAVGLLREAEEAVRTIRNKGWDNISTNGTFHPTVSGNEWILAANSETINGFSREIVVDNTFRSPLNGPIADQNTPGATLDPSTKTITITVSWTQPYSSSISSKLYLTRHLDNAAYTETTQTQFNAGTKTGVNVRATSPSGIPDDGEIVLGAGGYGDWCAPNLTSSSFDISGSGVSQGIWTIEGKAFIGTGDNASGIDFINVAINNPPRPTPPSITEQGTFDQNLKTNDVFGETVSGTYYGYIATNNNSKEIVILNASNNPPTQVSSIDINGSAAAYSVFALNDILYATAGTKLYTYNIANRSSPQYRGQINLHATGLNLYVVGNYVYVAESDSSRGLEIVQVSNGGSTLSIVGYATVNGETGRDTIVNQSANRAYMITTVSSSKPELFIINLDSKNGSRSTIATYDTNGMDPKALTLTPGNRIIVVGHGGIEYQVVNIDNESTPFSCGSVNTPENLNGVSAVLENDGDAYSYLLTTNASAEFRILEGGPGGSYATSGTFESQTLNPGYPTANNRLTASFSEPANTEIQFQVALADQVSGNCPATGGYTFIGPDGTSSTKFNQTSGTPITFPFTTFAPSYTNPGQCMRYKAFFTTSDTNSSPVLNDVTVNYSP